MDFETLVKDIGIVELAKRCETDSNLMRLCRLHKPMICKMVFRELGFKAISNCDQLTNLYNFAGSYEALKDIIRVFIRAIDDQRLDIIQIILDDHRGFEIGWLVIKGLQHASRTKNEYMMRVFEDYAESLGIQFGARL